MAFFIPMDERINTFTFLKKIERRETVKADSIFVGKIWVWELIEFLCSLCDQFNYEPTVSCRNPEAFLREFPFCLVFFSRMVSSFWNYRLLPQVRMGVSDLFDRTGPMLVVVLWCGEGVYPPRHPLKCIDCSPTYKHTINKNSNNCALARSSFISDASVGSSKSFLTCFGDITRRLSSSSSSLKNEGLLLFWIWTTGIFMMRLSFFKYSWVNKIICYIWLICKTK